MEDVRVSITSICGLFCIPLLNLRLNENLSMLTHTHTLYIHTHTYYTHTYYTHTHTHILISILGAESEMTDQWAMPR